MIAGKSFLGKGALAVAAAVIVLSAGLMLTGCDDNYRRPIRYGGYGRTMRHRADRPRLQLRGPARRHNKKRQEYRLHRDDGRGKSLKHSDHSRSRR